MRSRLNLSFRDDDFLLYIDGKLVLDMAGKHNPLKVILTETGAVDVYGLNKDGATEDGYPINKISIMHRRIFMKNDANWSVFRYGRTFAGIHKITIFMRARSGVST